MSIYQGDSGVVQHGSASVAINGGVGATTVTLNVAMEDTTYAVNITRIDGVNYLNMQYTINNIIWNIMPGFHWFD